MKSAAEEKLLVHVLGGCRGKVLLAHVGGCRGKLLLEYEVSRRGENDVASKLSEVAEGCSQPPRRNFWYMSVWSCGWCLVVVGQSSCWCSSCSSCCCATASGVVMLLKVVLAPRRAELSWTFGSFLHSSKYECAVMERISPEFHPMSYFWSMKSADEEKLMCC